MISVVTDWYKFVQFVFVRCS